MHTRIRVLFHTVHFRFEPHTTRRTGGFRTVQYSCVDNPPSSKYCIRRMLGVMVAVNLWEEVSVGLVDFW